MDQFNAWYAHNGSAAMPCGSVTDRRCQVDGSLYGVWSLLAHVPAHTTERIAAYVFSPAFKMSLGPVKTSFWRRSLTLARPCAERPAAILALIGARRVVPARTGGEGPHVLDGISNGEDSDYVVQLARGLFLLMRL